MVRKVRAQGSASVRKRPSSGSATRPAAASPGSRSLRTAVIGCGVFGTYHVRAYAEHPRSELVLLCDLQESRARRLARRFGCDYTTRTAEVARRDDIQAVSIATPDFAHTQVALQMIRAGKHLLIEKPLATTVREARRIVEAARRAGVRVMVDFHNRFSPPFVKAKEAVEAGTLGRVVSGFARLSNRAVVPLKWLSWAGRSGPQWFLLPHVVDLVRWLTGQEVREVFAVGTKGVLKAKGVDTYDTVQALLRLEEGSIQLDTSWILPDSWPSNIDFRVELIGTKGTLEVDAEHQLLEVAGRRLEHPFTTGYVDAHGETAGFFLLPIRHFVNCLLEDKPFVSPGEDGLAVTRIIAAVERSIETGRPVRVD